jgi:DNA polymerase-3 subunit alpha
VLAPTYGLMIYQEQVMQVAQRLAGYSLGEADNLRKAAAKKQRDLMAQERSKFVAGCESQGHSAAFATQIFDIIEPFADYSFPKAHATGYGLIAYQTAYLKANHPDEYLAALLTSVKSNKDQTAVFLNECRQLGIPVLVPDVNESESDFSVHPVDEHGDGRAAIRFGMSAVRNVGEGVVAQIVAARTEGGPFTDFYDFCDRVDPTVLNKRTIESLVKAGGFDSVGHPRQGLLHAFETIVDTVIDRRRNEAEGQFDLFSASGDTEVEAVVGSRVAIPDTEFAKPQRLAFEKEMLGLYVSEHPLMGAERSLRRHVDATVPELRELREGELRAVGGIVTSLVRRYTRRGDLMGTFVLEDLAGVVEVMVFPRTMTDFGHLLDDDAIVVVKGRVDLRDDSPKLIATEIARPELVLDGGEPVKIRVKLHALTDDKAARLQAVLAEHPGDSAVFVHLESPDKTTVLRLGDDYLVDPGNGLFAELRVLLGKDCLA